MTDPISVQEAAKRLGISSRAVYNLAAPGGPIEVTGFGRNESNDEHRSLADILKVAA